MQFPETLPTDRYAPELSIVLPLVRQAGEIALRYSRGPLQVSYKGKNDPVTQADREINHLLVAGLRRAFPDDAVLAEESADHPEARLGNPRLWCVDPLDGTREFTERLPQWCIMVGLAVHERATLGVVYAPAKPLLMVGVASAGAWQWTEDGWQRLQVSRVQDPAEATVVVSRSHRSPKTDALLQALGIRREIRHGSVGLKISLLALQQADLYLHPSGGTKEWDLCAPEAILHGAGGRMTDLWGRPFRYNRPDPRNPHGLIASNGFLHEAALEAVRRVLGPPPREGR